MRAFLHILTNLKTSEVKTLTASPADWQDLSIRTFRSMRYNGVFSSDGISQRFPKVGGRHEDQCGYYFISDAYETDGTDAEIKYERKILDPFTHAYIPDFVGMLDFNADAGWNYTDQWWEIKSKDSSKSNKFITRDEIDYNIFSLVSTDDVTVPDFDNPYQDAYYKKVDLFLELALIGKYLGSGTIFTGDGDGFLGLVSSGVIINEVGNRNSISDEWDGEWQQLIYTNELDTDVIITDLVIEAKVDVDFYFNQTSESNSAEGEVRWFLFVRDKDGNSIANLSIADLETNEIANITEEVYEQINHYILIQSPSFTIPPGGYMTLQYLVGFRTSNNMRLDWFSNTQNISFSYYEKTVGWPDNSIKGMMVHEVATRLFQLQTSETDTTKLVYAPILGKEDSEFRINPIADTYPEAGYLSYEHLTNGFQLRQITGRAINVSFWKLFQSLSAITPLGCVYEEDKDRLYIDSIENFYENEVMPIHLGYVTELKTYAYKDAYYNKIFSGYKSTDYEEFNGANEVNSKTEHQTAVNTKSNKTLSSDIYADTVNMEIARRANFSIEVSKDTKQDKLNFLTTLDEGYETVQGGITIIDAWKGANQYYNLTKTPRQNLQRQLKTEAAQFFKKVDGKIKFTSSSKDNNIRYVDPETGNTVNEFDDINVGNTDNSRLFNAEIDEFEGLYTYEIRQAIKNNKHKMIPYYNKDGNERFGYILEIDGLIVQQKAQYKVIRANTNI